MPMVAIPRPASEVKALAMLQIIDPKPAKEEVAKATSGSRIRQTEKISRKSPCHAMYKVLCGSHIDNTP